MFVILQLLVVLATGCWITLVLLACLGVLRATIRTSVGLLKRCLYVLFGAGVLLLLFFYASIAALGAGGGGLNEMIGLVSVLTCAFTPTLVQRILVTWRYG